MGFARDLESQWVIDDDRFRGRQRPRMVWHVGWNDRRIARAENLFGTADRDGDPTGGHIPDLFLRVVMLMNRHGIGVNVIGSDGHVLRMEETSSPPRKRLSVRHVASVDEGHEGSMPLAALRSATGTALLRRRRQGRRRRQLFPAQSMASKAGLPAGLIEISRQVILTARGRQAILTP